MAGGASDVGLGFLRLAGLGLAYHGYQKIFGGNMSRFAGGVEDMGFPLPIVFAWAAALSELVGGALAATTMFVAAFLHHATDDFAEREKAISYLAIMLALACLGAGKWSIDGMRKGN